MRDEYVFLRGKVFSVRLAMSSFLEILTNVHLGLATTVEGVLMELIPLRASASLDLPEINARRVRSCFVPE